MSGEPGEGDTRISRSAASAGGLEHRQPGQRDDHPRHRAAVREPQRRRPLTSARRLSVDRHGRRRQWRRPERRRTGSHHAARQDAAHRRRLRVAVRYPPEQSSFIGRTASCDEILGVRLSAIRFRFGSTAATTTPTSPTSARARGRRSTSQARGQRSVDENYGWHCYEGPDPFNASSGCVDRQCSPSPCNRTATPAAAARSPAATYTAGRSRVADRRPLLLRRFLQRRHVQPGPGRTPREPTYSTRTEPWSATPAPSARATAATWSVDRAWPGGTTPTASTRAAAPDLADPCLTCAATPLGSCRQPGVNKAVLVAKNDASDDSQGQADLEAG